MRLLLIQPYTFAETSALYVPPADASREARLINFEDYGHLLQGLAWDVHPGPVGPFGDSFVETREEFAIVGALRLPIVREACASGQWDAVVLLGGGDPGFIEAREIGQRFGVPVVACAHAQMVVAGMLGHRFGVLDVTEVHNAQMAELVVRYRMVEHCAGVRCIDAPLPRPSRPGAGNVQAAKAAGVQCVGLTYGYNHGRPIDDESPSLVIDDLRALLPGCADPATGITLADLQASQDRESTVAVTGKFWMKVIKALARWRWRA